MDASGNEKLLLKNEGVETGLNDLEKGNPLRKDIKGKPRKKPIIKRKKPIKD